MSECRYDGDDSRQKAVGVALIVAATVVGLADALLIACVVADCVAVVALRRWRRLANDGRTDAPV